MLLMNYTFLSIHSQSDTAPEGGSQKNSKATLSNHATSNNYKTFTNNDAESDKAEGIV